MDQNRPNQTDSLTEADRLILANESLTAAARKMSHGIKRRLTSDLATRRTAATRAFKLEQAARQREFAVKWKAESIKTRDAIKTETANATADINRQIEANALRLSGMTVSGRRPGLSRRKRLSITVTVATILVAAIAWLAVTAFGPDTASASPITVCSDVPDSSGPWLRQNCSAVQAAASDPAVTPFIASSAGGPKQTAYAFLPNGLDYLYQVVNVQQTRPEADPAHKLGADPANPTPAELTAQAVEVNRQIHATLVLDANNIPDPDASIAAFIKAWYGPAADVTALTPLFQPAWQS